MLSSVFLRRGESVPSESPPNRHKVFISYNQADRQWAEWIAWQLEEAGYQVVLQAWDFVPGSHFALEMNRAVQSAECTVVVLSPSYLTSEYTQPEWAAAFARDPKGSERRLLPVRVVACRPKGLLAQIVYLDLVGLRDEGASKRKLLAAVLGKRRKPQHPPSFPGSLDNLPKKPSFPGGTVDDKWLERLKALFRQRGPLLR